MSRFRVSLNNRSRSGSDSVFRLPERTGGSLVAGYSGDSTIGNMTNLDEHPRFVSQIRQR